MSVKSLLMLTAMSGFNPEDVKKDFPFSDVAMKETYKTLYIDNKKFLADLIANEHKLEEFKDQPDYEEFKNDFIEVKARTESTIKCCLIFYPELEKECV